MSMFAETKNKFIHGGLIKISPHNDCINGYSLYYTGENTKLAERITHELVCIYLEQDTRGDSWHLILTCFGLRIVSSGLFNVEKVDNP